MTRTRPRGPRRLRFVGLSTLVAVASAGCGGAGVDRPTSAIDSPSEALSGWSAPDLAWQPCADASGYECTTLEVPVDWAARDGKTIELALGRHQATGKRLGTLVTNPGGPGASGLQFLFGGPLQDELSERFDVVSWDPRGVGESTAFDCEENVGAFLALDPDPDTEAEQQALDARAEQVADDCERKNPDLVGAVGTDNVARDLEAIRLALGEEQLSYIGFSYGTLIGLRYLDMFAPSVRAMVLDGVMDPTKSFTDLLRQQTIAFDASLNRLFDACGRRADCPVDDLAATYDSVQRKVELSPIPAGSHQVGPAQLETAAIYAGYDPALWDDLADALATADAASSTGTGDGTAGTQLWNMAQSYYDLGGYAAYAAVECLDSPHPIGSGAYRAFSDELRKLSPRVGGSIANEMLVCAYWPVAPDPVVGTVIAPESSPTLVLGNRGDSATPYENSVAVAEALERGQLVSYDGDGHTSSGRSDCVDNTVNDYLVNLTVPERDPDCR